MEWTMQKWSPTKSHRFGGKGCSGWPFSAIDFQELRQIIQKCEDHQHRSFMWVTLSCTNVQIILFSADYDLVATRNYVSCCRNTFCLNFHVIRLHFCFVREIFCKNVENAFECAVEFARNRGEWEKCDLKQTRRHVHVHLRRICDVPHSNWWNLHV